jgi:GT2 family glycosyltransferase
MAAHKTEVLVSMVTWNDSRHLEDCLRSVRRQTVPVRIKVFDNASVDSSARLASRSGAETISSKTNIGFSGGHNHNLEGAGFRYALILNPDVVLDHRFLETCLNSMENLERVGLAGGKLYRMDDGGNAVYRGTEKVLDSTGMYITPSIRHFDRGSEEPDLGQYEQQQKVFGVTGAALIVDRRFYEDSLIEGEFLDEDFFAYREDADLAWRAQLFGWDVLYEPRANGAHIRKVLPSRRRRLKKAVNYHSVKNRFLLRMKNMDNAVRLRCFPTMWLRDLAVFGYLPFFERNSIPALFEALKLRHRMRRKKRLIQERRRVSGKEIARWFSYRPVAFNL